MYVIIGKSKYTLLKELSFTKTNNNGETKIAHLEDINPSERNDIFYKIDFTFI